MIVTEILTVTTKVTFIEKALEGNEHPEFYIKQEDETRGKLAFNKKSLVDFANFIYNFKMWITTKKSDLPLLTSSHCCQVFGIGAGMARKMQQE